MNFFSRNSLGDRTGGSFRGNGYWIGQAGPSRRAFIRRIGTSTNALGDLYNRNAELPLEFRVPGPVYAAVAKLGDDLHKKYVIPFNQYPDAAYYWDAPADEDMANSVDAFERQVFDFSEQLRDREKAYQAAQEAATEEAPAAAPGGQATEEIAWTPGVEPPPAAKSFLPVYIGIGIVAVAAIVGAALMSHDPEATSGPVETIPRGAA